MMFRFQLWLMACVFAATSALACDLPSQRPQAIRTAPVTGFDTDAFAQTVAGEIGAGFMGYAVTLRDADGAMVARINHGYARTPCEDEGEQKFTGATEAPIGSVSKVLTAALVIHRAENLSSVSLDDPFSMYIPAGWANNAAPGLHPNLQAVTLRNLLEHKGGFAKSGRSVFGSDVSFRQRLMLGAETARVQALNQDRDADDQLCVPVPVTQSCYSNTSFALWNVSMASLLPRKWANVEEGYRPGEITYDSYIIPFAYNMYRTLMQEKLFDPVGVTAGCNRYSTDANFAHNYEDRNEKNGRNRSEDLRPCAIGGWFMSTRALSKAVHRIVHTREVVDENHDAMFLSNGADRLVFSSKRRLSDGLAFSHNGSRFAGSAKAEIVVLPNGMVAAGIANSNKSGDGKGLLGAIYAGYEAGLAGPGD